MRHCFKTNKPTYQQKSTQHSCSVRHRQHSTFIICKEFCFLGTGIDAYLSHRIRILSSLWNSWKTASKLLFPHKGCVPKQSEVSMLALTELDWLQWISKQEESEKEASGGWSMLICTGWRGTRWQDSHLSELWPQRARETYASPSENKILAPDFVSLIRTKYNSYKNRKKKQDKEISMFC